MAADNSPEELEGRGFVVSDKRLFSPSGDKIADPGTPETAESEAVPSAAVPSHDKEEPAATAPPERR